MSNVQYNGMHDISFWEPGNNIPKFAWNDFHLIPQNRPFIEKSEVNYAILSIPKSSNTVNITNKLPGGKTFSAHSGSWSFIIDHDSWGYWPKSYRELQEYFNGKRLYVGLLDDPEHIYIGRFSMSGYTPGSNYTTVTITYNLDYEPLSDSDKENLKFRIRFLDVYGNVLQETYETYGEIPVYAAAAQSQSEYIIDGYDKPIARAYSSDDYVVYRRPFVVLHAIIFESINGESYTSGVLPSNVTLGKGYA